MRTKMLVVFLVLILALPMLAACASNEPVPPPLAAEVPEGQAAEAPVGYIPHDESVEIRWPAIIEVDRTVNASRPFRIAYANWNDENSIAIIVRDSVVDAARFYGVEVIVMDNQQDPMQAMTNAQNAIQMEVDFYLNFNQDESINAAIAELLEENGISMISIQTAARPGIDPEYHVNNHAIGYICGEMLVYEARDRWADVPEEEVILFIAGHPEAGVNFIARANAVIEAVTTRMPNVTVVEISTDGSPEVTRQRTADFLTANPAGNILMWSHIDQNTLGMLAAVRAADREDDVIITSFGANPVIFPELLNPDSAIIGTVAQFSERFGWDLLPMVLRYLNDGTPIPLVTMPPLDIITAENLHVFYPEAVE